MNYLGPRPAPAIRFIEFMGLPGSGKSTIAAHLESDLRKYGIKIISRSAEFADNSHFLWRHYRRFLHVVRNAGRCRRVYFDALKLITNTRQKSYWDLAKVTWNFWSVIAFMADCRSTRDGLIVIDQGLFQAIWSIQLSASKVLSPAAWNELLRTAGITDVLVVNIQSGIPVARLVARAGKRTRLGSRPHDIHADTWQLAAANMAALTNLAYMILPRDQSGDRVITIENDATCPGEAASEIAAAFLARLKPPEASGFHDLCSNI